MGAALLARFAAETELLNEKKVLTGIAAGKQNNLLYVMCPLGAIGSEIAEFETL